MSLWIPIIISVVSVIADQFSKYLVVHFLKPIKSIPMISGLLDFTYVENYGAAYGSFQNKKILLVGVTAILIALLIYLIISKKIEEKSLVYAFSLIIGGGLGNLIDRMRIGYVVDFIDVNPLFSFPVFNVADCCVVIGAAIFIIYVLFFDNKKKEKTNE